MNCFACNKELTKKQMYYINKYNKPKGYCCPKCFGTSLENKVTKDCIVCGIPFTIMAHHAKVQRICSRKCLGKVSSERLKVSNPLHKIEARNKLSLRNKRLGIKLPPGGNGLGILTIPQQRLIDAIPLECEPEYSVPTGYKAGMYPTHYRIDIAIPNLMLAIEVDGPQHQRSKGILRDSKKEEFLSSKNWTVLRFTNAEVMDDISQVVHIIFNAINKQYAS